MKIGNVHIETPVVLAPMAGVTDYPFRILCKEMGAGVVYSEFVSADGIIRENTKTLSMIRFEESERPIGIQIFGNDAETMGQAAKYVVETFRPDILDINYGCPVPKVTKKGGGSAALQDLCLMDDITAAVVESIPETPVTVKMRVGWNQLSIVVPEVGERLEKIGVKVLEEAAEVVDAARELMKQDGDQAGATRHLVAEAADLVYHLLVMLGYFDLTLEPVENELDRRFGVSGLDEKAARD